MIWTMVSCRACRRAGTMVALAAAVSLTGCGLLDASDPTQIEDAEVANASSADMMRRAAILRLADAANFGTFYSGMLADELSYDPYPPDAIGGVMDGWQAVDRRESVRAEAPAAYDNSYWTTWQRTRRAAMEALAMVRAYMEEPARSAYAGQLLAIRGLASVSLAETICPGFPMHDEVDGNLALRPPYTTTEAFERGLADFDSAVVAAADSARILDFARVGQGRALLGLGRFAEAATAVAAVPTEYVAKAEPTSNEMYYLIYYQYDPGNWRGVSNLEGGNGLDFVAAHDPRVPTMALGPAANGVDSIYAATAYTTTPATPIVIASGVEARLIEAEAALNGGGNWLGMLNALRTTCVDALSCPDPAPAGSGGVAGLPPLADPGTDAARVDLLFRERAFWLFATQHRLGDLRRLIAFYDRDAESVFPSGAYRVQGFYASATSLPFPTDRERNVSPAITGCTSR